MKNKGKAKGLLIVFCIMLLLITIDIILYKVLSENKNIPKPGEYYISEQARVFRIVDYEYDEDDRLTKSVEYSDMATLWDVENKKIVFYSVSMTSKWRKKDETFYSYDSCGRLVKEEHYVLASSKNEPYDAVVYQYDSDGGYTKISSMTGGRGQLADV